MSKNKWLLVPINFGFLALPWVVGQLVINTQEGDAAQAAGMAIGLSLMALTPGLIVIGLLTTILTSKSPDAFKYSIMGFGIPSGIVSLLCLALLINN